MLLHAANVSNIFILINVSHIVQAASYTLPMFVGRKLKPGNYETKINDPDGIPAPGSVFCRHLCGGTFVLHFYLLNPFLQLQCQFG